MRREAKLYLEIEREEARWKSCPSTIFNIFQIITINKKSSNFAYNQKEIEY